MVVVVVVVAVAADLSCCCCWRAVVDWLGFPRARWQHRADSLVLRYRNLET